MESIYSSYSLKDFRKIVSDHNKREKKDIMEEVKKMRLADREKIKQKKQQLLDLRTIKITKLKKPELVKKVLENDYINKKIKKVTGDKPRQTVDEDKEDLLDFLQQDYVNIISQYQKDSEIVKLEKNIDKLEEKAKKGGVKLIKGLSKKDIVNNVLEEVHGKETVKKDKKKKKFIIIKSDDKPKAPARTKFNIKKNNPITNIFNVGGTNKSNPIIKVSDFDDEQDTKNLEKNKKKLLFFLEYKKEDRNKLKPDSPKREKMDRYYLSTVNMKAQSGLGGKGNPSNERERLMKMIKEAKDPKQLKTIEKYIQKLARYHFGEQSQKPFYDRFFNPEKFEEI